MFRILLDPVGHEALALDETFGIHASREEATMPETLIELCHSSGFDLPALVRGETTDPLEKNIPHNYLLIL